MKINGSIRLIVLHSLGLLLLIFHAQPAFPQQSSLPRTDNQIFNAKLQILIQAAQNNPRLKSADAKVQASSHAADIKKSLDPPQLAVEFYNAPVTSFPNPFKNQMEYDYSIQQMLPFPGKLGAMAEAQRKRTEMLKADRQTLEQEIVRNVKSVYYELYLIYRRMEINQETQDLVRGFVDIARKQYEVGMGKQSDVLRAQTELTTLINDSIILVQQRKSMEGMLNSLCNKPLSAELGSIPEVEPMILNYDLSALLAIAEKNRPELKSMLADVEMQRTERAAARKDYLPDFMVRGMYKQMTQSSDDWSLMVGVTVPVAPWSLGKYSSATARSEANIGSAQSERDNMKNMIASEVNDALLKMESGKQRLKLSKETAIPQARQTLESALSAYSTGKQEFLMLIDIERMLVMAKLDYHMAVMTLLDAQSRLERAVGLSIDEINGSSERGNR